MLDFVVRIKDACPLATITTTPQVILPNPLYYEVYTGNNPDIIYFDAAWFVSSETVAPCPPIALKLYHGDQVTLQDPLTFLETTHSSYVRAYEHVVHEQSPSVAVFTYYLVAYYETLDYTVESVMSSG